MVGAMLFLGGDEMRTFALKELPSMKDLGTVEASTASKALGVAGYDAYGFGDIYEIAILEWSGLGWHKEKSRWVEAYEVTK